MARAAHNILVLVLIGVTSAAYLDDLQAPAASQLSLTNFNGAFGGAPLANDGYNGNGGGGGGSPGRGTTRGTFGGNNGRGGGLAVSGSSIGGSVVPGTNGFGGAGFATNFEDLSFYDSDPITALESAIGGGGVPGEDYPILSSVPTTRFSCEGQLPGYYADTDAEAGCQVFHICQDGGRIDSFLCPNGTIFNQQYFVCDWWYNFDCSTAEQFYELNALIGQVGANSDSFGSASSSQGSFSSFSNGNVNGGSPSSVYQVPESSNGNTIGSRGNGNNDFSNGRGNARRGDRLGSATDRQSSFSPFTDASLNGGAPSSLYGTPSVNNGNFGASSNRKAVLRNGKRKNGNGRKNGGFSNGNVNGGAPSSNYQLRERVNGNRVGSGIRQNNILNNGQESSFGGERFGSATDQQSSFNLLNGVTVNGDAPSSLYGPPSVNNDNFGASSNTQAVVNNGNGGTGGRGRNGGHNSRDVQPPSGLYQTPGK
ncbi:pro-resilin-like isoform X2 [Homarus americanus]|uniref:pro-resilin-like isoform X2 n=1 Tax=Homarus americanus TaxID=6706 RepID=UPI001C45A0B0|nr:pro-resilin-like isoform X2 [Homarus americanus]